MQVKPYGRLPKEVRPYLPRLVDQLKAERVPYPYKFIAEVFNVSASRVQQVVLRERGRVEAPDPDNGHDSRATVA